jgi:hypothetical protein
LRAPGSALAEIGTVPAVYTGGGPAIVETLRRILYLIFRPAAEWDVIAREKTSVDALLRRYILPLSLLAPAATVIGMMVFDASWDPQQGYLVPSDQIFAAGATTFFSSVATLFALAAIFVLLGPIYGSSRDYVSALKVSVYGAIPVLLAGATLVLPAMIVVALIGLCHTMFLYWVGARRVLEVSSEYQTEFIGISMVLLALVSVLSGALASSIGLI